MANLILRYLNNPTPDNARKVIRYNDAHPFGACILNATQTETLNAILTLYFPKPAA